MLWFAEFNGYNVFPLHDFKKQKKLLKALKWHRFTPIILLGLYGPEHPDQGHILSAACA